MHARYRIEAPIGEGGMGTILRAYDRLTNTWVALKQLTLELEADAAEMTAAEREALRLALASEFRLLATLRHPHIVSVLDYGFVQNAAFFTMEHLAAGQPFTQAAQGQPLAVRLQLLGQLLQALEYVRRHHVVHRDLKPDNVLVQAGQVKVLDFGLAAAEGQHSTSMGSLFYMAPESFAEEQPITHTTDLFAVGVMAYEILAEHRPFDAMQLTDLVQQIQTLTPNYEHLQGPPALQPVIARLLAKDPAARYQTAAEALVALAAASDNALPVETQATRSSLIKAAPLVGREAELGQLTNALTQAEQGQGSAWLLGGESGVGKSRLLDELRIQALVRRAWVWQGQAMSEGGRPAELWLNILRWLALTAAPSDFEAGVLKPFVADLADLLERPIPDAPALESANAQARFLTVVVTLLQRVAAHQPLVLLLEDLHWVGPLSLSVLKEVVQRVNQLPLLILGTYREDERPTLPRELLQMQHLNLNRLTQAQVGALVSAILGQTLGDQAHLTRFLYQQTEGNAFFLVEVLRTLAEETGLLSQIAQMQLPPQVLAEGIQQVVQRRLQRVAAADYALLELAALSGRELDLPLLKHLAPTLDTTAWLSRCAEAAVLAPQGATWHFAHDQLRRGVVGALSPERQRAVHQTLAVGLEQTYAAALAPTVEASKNQNPFYARLAYHWQGAGQLPQALNYLEKAGEQALQQGAYREALNFFAEALALAPQAAVPAPQQAAWQRRLGEAYFGTGDLRQGEHLLRQALAGLGAPVPTERQLGWGILKNIVRQVGHRLRQPAPGVSQGHYWEMARAYQWLVHTAFHNRQRVLLLYVTLSMANAAEHLPPSPELVNAYATLYLILDLLGLKRLAMAYRQRAQAVIATLGQPSLGGWLEQLTGICTLNVGQWDAVFEHLHRALALTEQVGDWRLQGDIYPVLIPAQIYTGDLAQAEHNIQRLQSLIQQEGNQTHLFWYQSTNAFWHLRRGQLATACDWANQGLATAQAIQGGATFALMMQGWLGSLLQWRGERALAWAMGEALWQGMQHLATTPVSFSSVGIYTGLCEVYLNAWAHPVAPTRARYGCQQLARQARAIPIAWPMYALYQGQLAWRLGQPAKAVATWRKGLQAAEKFTMPFEQGLLQLQLGQHGPADQRAAHLTAALKLFEQLASVHFLGQTQQLLAASA